MTNPTFTMKVFFAIAFLIPLFGSSNAAAIANIDRIEKRDSASPLVLTFDVSRGNLTIKTEAKSAIAKSASVPAPLTNENEVSYDIELSIGSNKQRVKVALDTGSSDLWVIGPDASCQNCGARYDPSSSSTSNDLGIQLFDAYGIGEVEGEYYSDDVFFGSNQNVKVKALQLGVAEQLAEINTGILGIGFETLEGVISEGGQQYTNFPAALVEQGIIPKNAYSLYLNSPDAETGTIIFGGYDKAKYSGNLVTLPITDSRYLAVEVPSISIKGTTISYNTNALLDSGTTLAYISRSIAAQFAQALGSTRIVTDENQDFYVVDCGLQNSDETFDINFTKGLTIKVPIGNFVFQYTESTCVSGFVPQDGEDASMGVFGDAFLRSAYLVYDLDEKTIQAAQVKYTDESNVVSI